MKQKSKKRFRINQMSFRNRIITLTILISVGAAFLLTIVFGMVYHRSILDDYRSEIKSHLYDTDTVFQSYADNISALATSLYTVPEGTLVRVSREYEIASHYSFLGYIQNQMTYSGYIHSVYFLNQDGQINLWAKGVGSYTKNLENGMLNAQLAGKTKSPFVWNIPHRYNEKMIPMLTFFFQEVPLGMPYYAGTVVINLELDNLVSRILNTENASTEMILLDQNGTVILHSNPKYIGEDWSERSFVPTVLAGERSFNMKVDGERYEFICMPSKLEGFYWISGMDYTDISILTKGFLSIPIVGLLMIIFLVLLSVRVGDRVTQPLIQTVQGMRQSRTGERIAFSYEEDRDELNFLQKYASHVEQYVEEVLENDMKNKIIYNLVRNDRNVNIQPFLLKNGILQKDRGYCVIVAEFVCRYEVNDLEELNSIRQSISRVMEEILGKFGHCTGYEHGLRHLLFLVSENEEMISVQELQHELEKGCSILMKENARTDIYMVVSQRIENSEESCKPIIKKNNERLEVLPVYRNNFVEVAQEKVIITRPSDKTLECCVHALKTNHRENYLQSIEQMLEETKEVSYPQFVSWVVWVTEKIYEVKAAMHRNYVKPEQNKLYNQVQQIHNQESLIQWFEFIYDDISEKMDEIRNTTTAGLIEEAVEYIMQNFGDSQLGAVSLAKRLHISAQYFGQLFMEFTGKSVSEYIIQVRMEKARNFLLARPELEIMEIAERVGYNSASYFSTAFKKYYGVTPSKLRSSLNVQE